jgi:hypothetical protein
MFPLLQTAAESVSLHRRGERFPVSWDPIRPKHRCVAELRSFAAKNLRAVENDRERFGLAIGVNGCIHPSQRLSPHTCLTRACAWNPSERYQRYTSKNIVLTSHCDFGYSTLIQSMPSGGKF